MSDKKEDVKPNIKQVISEDRQKLGSFYNFSMDDSKLKEIKKRSTKQMGRFAITGIVFGFFTQWLLGNGKIYDNIIKKTTMRRLSIDLFIKMQRKRKMIECKKGLARQKEKQKHKEIIKSFDTMTRPIKGKIFTWTNYYNNSKLVNV